MREFHQIFTKCVSKVAAYVDRVWVWYSKRKAVKRPVFQVSPIVRLLKKLKKNWKKLKKKIEKKWKMFLIPGHQFLCGSVDLTRWKESGRLMDLLKRENQLRQMADVVDDGHVLIQSADDDDLSSCFSPQYFTFLKKCCEFF